MSETKTSSDNMSQIVLRKKINIFWVAPNGRHYEENIMMSLDEYQKFVNDMLAMKRANGDK